MSQTSKSSYRRPVLISLGNLKAVTADWQCSIDSDYREREHEREGRGGGHGHGHGND